MSGSNPPSTSGSPCLARRALLTSAATLVVVAALVTTVVVTASADTSAPTGPAASSRITPFHDGQSELVWARTAARANRVHSLASTSTVAVIEVPTTEAPVAPPTTAAPTPPPPAPAPAVTSGDPNDPASWDRLAQCESEGNWAINTGNGYYGGLQFSLSSWRGVGGTGYPNEHSREVQIEMGQRLYAQGGWSQWPACTRSFGWR